MKRAVYHIEFDRETDGRWIAEVLELPGVMVYGVTKDAASSAVVALALRVLADRIESGEEGSDAIVGGMFAAAS